MSHQSTTKPQNGISIKDALSILSTRSNMGGNRNVTADLVSDELKEMGQLLDMEQQDVSSTSPSPPARISVEVEANHEAIMAERERRTEQIQQQLQTLDIMELLKMIFQAQQERVVTYKVYDRGLNTILISGNMTSYPKLCAKVTATFSVLSDTMNSIKSTLNTKHKRVDITKIIAQIQKSEGEKLNLTAAIHLEKLRLNNAQVENEAWNDSERDERTVSLLEEGVATLQAKINMIIEEINESIEELRCIATDE